MNSLTTLFLVLLSTLLSSPNLIDALSAADRLSVLDCHNALRSTLAKGTAQNVTGLMPAGSNLIQLSYNTTIEAIAQSWANQCSMSHSASAQRPGLGENLYMYSSSTPTDADLVKAACNSWWSELKQYGIQSSLVLTDSNWYPIGHWSQQAWAKTAQIGCAVARCPTSTWKSYVVCNYGAAGNYLGQPVYAKGTACSACPAGYGVCNTTNGLCMQSNAAVTTTTTTTIAPMTTTTTTGVAPTTTTTANRICDVGWSKFNGYCYKLFPYSTTGWLDWTQANAECTNKYGAQLVSIHSKAENDFIVSLYTGGTSGSIWIGLYKPNVNYAFQWTDYKPMDYLNWTPGWPMPNENQCGAIYIENGGQWGNAGCQWKANAFVCKK